MTLRDIDLFAARMLGGAVCVETIANAVVAPSAIQGRGLFSLQARAAGGVLCILDGQLVDVDAHPAVIEALEWNAVDPRHLLVRPLRSSYGFINHSARPNVVIDDDGRTMRACRPIAAGEEFTMDYFAQPLPPAYLAGDEAAALRASKR